MKKCTYCGKEYSDDATVCIIDSRPLKIITAEGVSQGNVGREANDLLHGMQGVAKAVSGDPTGLAHIPAIKGRETEFGVCLFWKCPHCDDLRDFRLVAGEVNLSILGLDLANLGKLLDLRCTECRFELKVRDEDKPFVIKAQEATQLLKGGKITPPEYVATITDLPAKFVKNLLALTQNWNCQDCGEENPITFDTCWNCSSKTSASSAIPDDAKPFPGVPRGGNAWE